MYSIPKENIKTVDWFSSGTEHIPAYNTWLQEQVRQVCKIVPMCSGKGLLDLNAIVDLSCNAQKEGIFFGNGVYTLSINYAQGNI